MNDLAINLKTEFSLHPTSSYVSGVIANGWIKRIGNHNDITKPFHRLKVVKKMPHLK
jgi:hypothetical protein